ncbi:MAG: hypothetical protein JWN03_3382 [Nocardia sp.]|uniref:hypothetical protein n=1 Tax=Nocardia sp. TaxID=1821 RepID=UPI00262E76B8|nr:hypothetical protein [Nocardia sp.]MCU1643107.1 hypothetical protein [Nocardia sp.]
MTTLLPAATALAGSFGTLVLQARYQRIRAREDRVWSRCAETYIDLLRYQSSGMSEHSETATANELAVREDLSAKVAAFASKAVYELWQQSATASLDLEQYIENNHPDWFYADDYFESKRFEAAAEEDEDYRRVRKTKTDAEQKLAERIRKELHVDSHRKQAPIDAPRGWLRRRALRP